MHRRFVTRWLAAIVALPLAALTARAAVTVTGMTVAGTGAPYDITYVLNQDAASGTLEILNASNTVVRSIALTAPQLSRGPKIIQWDGKVTGGSNAAPGQYVARVTATAGAVPAGGALLWGPVNVASQTTPARFGIAVNKNPASPYYGRIYVSDYSNDTVRAYTSDGTKVLDITYPAGFPAGVRGLSVGADDRLYANIQTDSGVPAVAGVISVRQDGTDPVREADFTDQPRQMVVTGAGANRRFYYGQGITQTVGPGQVLFNTPGGTDIPLITSSDDPALSGTVDGIAVLDNRNDPAGHSNNTTIYVRTNVATSGGASTVLKFDNNSADPTAVPYTRDPNFNVSLPQPATAGFTGFGVAIGPDGHLWTSLSHSDNALRGFYKLDRATGAILDKVGPVFAKPRNVDTDARGNLATLLLPDATNSTWARQLAMYAPAGGPSTDASTTPSFTVSGQTLPPITITVSPAADASSASATITWTTDVASSSEVFYGTTSTALSNSVVNEALVTQHSVTITGLDKTKPYFFQVRSAAEGFASAQSAILSFTTKDVLGAPITPTATATRTSATITWTTPSATSSIVRYGTSPDALTQVATGNDNATSHTVTINGLTSGMTYYFVAQSGSATIETTSSAVSFFATLTANGSRVRSFTSMGDFKFGLLKDIRLTAGEVTLPRKGAPNGVDDAGVPDLPDRRANHAVVAMGGYLYVIGGRGAVNTNTVFVAPINADGTVGAWKQTTNLPDDRYLFAHGGFGYNGYVYVVGGGVPTTQQTTLAAKQNPVDGTLGPWFEAGRFSAATTPDGAERDFGAVDVYKGFAYYAGGENNAGEAQFSVLVAPINPDGTLGAWTAAVDTLPQPSLQHALVTHNERIYKWGGTNGDIAGLTDKLQSPIGPDGQPGPFTDSGTPMAEGRYGFAGDITHGYALMVGGTGLSRTDKISYADVLIDGALGDFVDAAATYRTGDPLRDMDGASWQDRFYVIGGRNTDAAATFDPGAVPYAAAVTFADSGSFVFSGHFESPIIDLGQAENMQTLAVSATGTGVQLMLRTAGADGVFTPWVTAAGLTHTFPAGANARYVQFILHLTSTGATAPVVNNVDLTYGVPGAIPVGVDDVVRALQIAGGLANATSADMTRLNVVNTGTSQNRIDILDAVALRRSF